MRARQRMLFAGVVLALVSVYACHKVGEAPSEPPADVGADGAPEVDAADETGAVSDAFAETTLSGDSTPTPMDAAAESEAEPPDDSSTKDVTVDVGEYCPDPDWPPRTDGCPCDPTRTIACSEAQLGKVCDYFPNCPSSKSGSRYTCTKVIPKEGAPSIKWVASTIDCLAPDAGPG